MANIFKRKSIGVSICSSGVYFALTEGPSSSPRVERVSHFPLSSDCMKFSLINGNIQDNRGFIDALKNAGNLLLSRGNRVSLALPDQAGRVMLLETEERFKSRAEGIEILKWKLKKRLAIETAEIHLDYQEVVTRNSGDMVVLVALMSLPVVRQYEELLAAAGFEASRIDFNFFNILRLFEKRLMLQTRFGLVTCFDASLAVAYFSDGRPEFIRISDLSGSPSVDERIQKEIKCSFLSYRSRYPEREAEDMFLFSPPGIAGDLRDIIMDETGVEPVHPDVRSAIAVMENVPSDQQSLFPFTAAIGASLRGL
jgi:type IV pilus assembly protein PilM